MGCLIGPGFIIGPGPIGLITLEGGPLGIPLKSDMILKLEKYFVIDLDNLESNSTRRY